MEITAEKLSQAREQAIAGFNPNAEIVTASGDDAKAVLQQAAESAGQMNTTAILDGETVEFFKKDEYLNDIENKVIITNTTSESTGRVFTNVYVLVNRYFKVGQKRVAEHFGFINVGGMVRRHYDLSEATKNEDGTYTGARRVVTPGTFNEKLAALRTPWAMLDELSGKKVVGKRGTTKRFYQEFSGRQPIRNKYVEQVGMEYSFAN